jgi:uncharacterized membrane protein
MTTGLRSTRERAIQTLWFEGVGLAFVAPMYAWVTGEGIGASFAMVAAVSVVVMAWSALFNTAFDIVEHRFTGRVASNRSHRLRAAHALAHEASSVIITCPVIYAMSDLGWGGTLAVNLGLTLAYTAYAYVFHLVFDRLRPVQMA